MPPEIGVPAVLVPRSAAYITKRILDLTLSSALLIGALPLMLVIAIGVKLDSRGPVMFRSPRVGRNGKIVPMLKFRTMIDGADRHRESLRPISDAADGLFKLKRDPRVTRLGAFLRATSLDELPQIVQVLRGSMSLVGPRPLPPDENALIKDGGHRLLARPGMTGPWQVAGSWQVPLSRMIELDNEYLAEWSAWIDLTILGRTLVHVLRRRGV